MIRQLLAISRHTFTESIRQPILAVLTLICAMALVLSPALAAYSLDDDNKLLIDMGLSSLFVAGLLMAAFTATGVVSRELEDKTALTVLSKPVPRPVFVLGKYLGVSAAIAIAFWVLCVIFLLTVRHRVMQAAMDPFDGPVLLFGITAAMLALLGAVLGNYFYNRVFASSLIIGLAGLLSVAWCLVLLINKDWHYQPPTTDWSPQLMAGVLLIFEGVLLLAAVAIVVSTCLGQMGTLAVCVAVFGLGLLSDYLFGRHADQSTLIHACYAVVPNLQLFWPADAITQGQPLTPNYIGLVTAYAACYTAALIGLACGLIALRELG